jgi:hypothetical protein
VSDLDETVRKILSLPREAGTPEAATARELVAAPPHGHPGAMQVRVLDHHPEGVAAEPGYVWLDTP